jgi:hypothetical protein
LTDGLPPYREKRYGSAGKRELGLGKAAFFSSLRWCRDDGSGEFSEGLEGRRGEERPIRIEGWMDDWFDRHVYNFSQL